MNYIYILSNKCQGTLYTGVTNDLKRRVYEHKQGLIKGFTQKYKIDQLMHFEEYENIEDTIIREKQIKAGSRKKKIELIENNNLFWKDLYLRFD